jgi:AcrR family transcriptional regulator
MAYRSSDKTRKKKDAKRTAMMQAAVRVFAEKGYHSATVRDVVQAADVAIGTFYFYFPDKETLFVHLYEETAEFLLQTIGQAMAGRLTFSQQVYAGISAYTNIAVYEPAVVQLLLVGGVGTVPSLTAKRTAFRLKLIKIWQRTLDNALRDSVIFAQNTKRSAEAITGAVDEVILQLLELPDPEEAVETAVHELAQFVIRAVGFEETE